MTVEIAALGHAPHLDWILRRLSAGGIAIATEAPPSPFLVADWLGLAAPGLLVDLGCADVATARQRAESCRAAPSAYVEVSALWHPLGERMGFMLFVGANEEASCGAQPLLDVLAPLPGAWLRCGPPGAAAFVYGLYARLWQAALAGYPYADPTDTVKPPDWRCVLQRQQELASELYKHASDYLAGLPDRQPDDSAALLAEFALPPLMQAHYARTLASVIVLALEQQHPTAQVLEQFWRNHHPD